tara:strand:- start:4012 stop:4974 length:963 start_codon:yes stop_codon:yes gene_type:complete
MKILVSGGSGYIGSVLCHILSKNKVSFAILDNLSNSNKKYLPKKTIFYFGSIQNKRILNKIYRDFNPTHIIHLAASIDVNESERKKDKYFKNNVTNSKIFLDFFISKGVKNIFFSSTAAVYSYSNNLITEKCKTIPVNYYGKTKLLIENFLLQKKKKNNFNLKIFRFFNVIGTQKNLKAGNTSKKSKHLFNSICYSIINSKEFIINGSNYSTLDGTCVRDFIDVQDLTKIIFFFLKNNKIIKEDVFNLGINKGYSVLNTIKKFETTLKVKINYKVGSKRKGDIPKLICSNKRLKKYYNSKFTNLRTTIRNHFKFYKILQY